VNPPAAVVRRPPSVARLAGLQHPDGCFPSWVDDPGGVRPDRNGFTTALALRALRDVPGGPRLARVRSAALDFVARCRAQRPPEAFGFWPEDARPAWAPRLPPDVDDTAIMAAELLRYGRIGTRDALRTVCVVLIPNRLTADPRAVLPPWVVPGCFRTWVTRREAPNVVDCCVNANAAALMAMVGATHLPGYAEAVRTVAEGVAWAGREPVRQQALTPFYPGVDALLEAVEHAVDRGATALASTVERLRDVCAGPDRQPPQWCCQAAYGRTRWRCPGLREAQALRRRHPA
jgi:hypothetical protein